MGFLSGLLGGGSNKQTTENNPWAPAQDYLKGILGNASDLFNQQGGINPTNTHQVADQNQGWANLINGLMNNGTAGAMTQAGTDALNNATGINNAANAYLNNATGGSISDTTANLANAAGNLINNDVLNSQISAAQNDIYNNLQRSTYTGINGAAAGSGNTNSSRTSIERGLAASNANQQAASIEATMRGNAYNNAVNQAQNAQNSAMANWSQLANNAYNGINAANSISSTNTNSMIAGMNAGGMQQNYDQSVLDNDYANSQLGWQNLNNYYNIIAGIGGMGGTSTSSTSSKMGWGQLAMGAASTAAAFM